MKCPNCGAEVGLPAGVRECPCDYCGALVQRPVASGAAGVFKLLEDRDGDGIPDLLQHGALGAGEADVALKHSSTVITVNGKQYNSLEECPADVRQLLQQHGGLDGLMQSGATDGLMQSSETAVSHVTTRVSVDRGVGEPPETARRPVPADGAHRALRAELEREGRSAARSVWLLLLLLMGLGLVATLVSVALRG